MVISMTGYGEGSQTNSRGTLKVDLKSVNHRFFEPVFRLPFMFSSLETDLRKQLAAHVRRGRVEVRLYFESSERDEGRLRLDPVAATAGLAALLKLEQLTGQHVENKAELLVGMEGMFKSSLPEKADDDLKSLALMTLNQAAENLNAMRRTEGEALAADVRAVCGALREQLQQVETLSAALPAQLKARLQERIETILGDLTEEYYPGQRLAAEVALLIDRGAIDEEIVRLDSHIDQMLTTLEADEPIGKQLDFLAQEMNREVNTIGSKSSDVELTALVVKMKNNVEKIREQVQNIE